MKSENKCAIKNCTNPIKAKGWCNKHYLRMWHYGSLKATRRTPGSGTISDDGYKCWDFRSGRVYEHRKLVEARIGRPLRGDEIIHHINGNKRDNRPENLLILTHTQHVKLHAEERGRQIALKLDRWKLESVYNRLKSTRKAAKELGISEASVRKYLRRYKIAYAARSISYLRAPS